MIKPNWNNFRSKFSGNPQENFEWFCYLLFCRQYNIPFIHRYKNQAAIETDPVEVKKQLIGWQAKFYDGTLTGHKRDLLDMIDKAVKYYPGINQIHLYTNSEWGQSRDGTPASKSEVENYAAQNGVEIKWLTQSFFESEFVTLACEDISKYFFTFENSIIDIAQELKEHTESALSKIDTKIDYNNQVIEINRDEEIQRIKSSESSIVFLMGNGGNGKTAIIKRLYEEIKDSNTAMYLLKAHELIGRSKNRLELLDIEAFNDYHSELKEKFFIIDSAEKLYELNNSETYVNVVTKLLKNGWTVVYTVRNHYVEPLFYKVNDIFGVIPERIEVDSLSNEELSTLAEKFNFSIPVSTRFLQLICVPFYLNEYLKNCVVNKRLDYDGFKKELWTKLIKKGDAARERFLIDFASEKALHSSFYIESDSEYASVFVDEGILGQDESGYFISHDIYEEWALEKHVKILYNSSNSAEDFFRRIDTSLSIRRAFRSWLGDLLDCENDIVITMVDLIRSGKKIESFWKDEILISILLSNQSEIFFESTKDKILENNLSILKKIAALLVTSCKIVDMKYSIALEKNSNQSLIRMTSPIGEGWKSFIKFVYKNISDIAIEKFGFTIKVLNDWVFYNKSGSTTKYAGRIALKYYEWSQDNRVYHSNKGFKKKILRTIVMSSNEIKSELKNIFDKIILNKWNHNRDPYNDLCDFILKDMSGNYVASVLTDELIQIMKLYWVESNEDKYSKIYGHSRKLESDYGLNEYLQNFYPSSSYQTPMRRILQADLRRGLDFCIWFADYTTDYYLKSRLARNEVWTTSIEKSDGEKVEIKLSNRLWCVYRGSQTNPHVLESVYMALEKELLKIGEMIGAEKLVPWMLYIIDNTKSAILLGIIASIVCAYPEDMFEVALKFFSHQSFFSVDKNRLSIERGFIIGGISRNSLHFNERQNSRNLEHRKVSLEELFSNYAIYYSMRSDEISISRINILYEILDKHYEKLENQNVEENLSWRMSLGRMDVRKMEVQDIVVEEQNCKKYTPVFDEEVEASRLKSLEESNRKIKYIGLSNWGRRKYKGEKISEYNKIYDNDISRVFAEFKLYLNELYKDDESLAFIGRELEYMIPALMYLEYRKELNESQVNQCERLLIEGIKRPYQDNFEYNSFNGMSYVYESIPLLISESMESIVEVEKYIVLALLDTTPINAINHFNIYAINALKAVVKQGNTEFVEKLLVKYAAVSVMYKDYIDEYRLRSKESLGFRPLSSGKIIRDFIDEYNDKIVNTINEIETSFVDLRNLQPKVKAIYFQIVSIIPNVELMSLKNELSRDVLEYYYEAEKNNSRKLLSDGFLRSYCSLLLTSDEKNRKRLFSPIKDKSIESDVTCDIAHKMILVEDSLNKRDAFWWWMKALKEKLYSEINLESRDIKYLAEYYRKIIRTIMLAEHEWNASGEWHSLNKLDMLYYKDLAEKLYFHPDVFGSMLKIVDKVGANHIKYGISIIANMLRKNCGFKDISIDENIIQYLEIIVRKFANQYRSEIRKNTGVKNDMITILSWMVDQESVMGYILRDEML